MKTIIRCSVVAMMSVFLLCSCGKDYSLDVYGSISGQVTNSATGDPIPAAQVTLVPGANTVQTSSDGSFSFSSLDEGQYTISVQKSGFQANRKNVTVVSGEKTDVIITLTIIPNNWTR